MRHMCATPHTRAALTNPCDRAWPRLSQAFDDFHSTSGGGPSEPIRAASLNAAKLLQDKFVAVLGTDLTVHSDRNPFWHTGSPCSQDTVGRDRLQKKPWEYMWEVAKGAMPGKGKSFWRTSQSYQRHVHRLITPGLRAHMWPAGGK